RQPVARGRGRGDRERLPPADHERGRVAARFPCASLGSADAQGGGRELLRRRGRGDPHGAGEAARLGRRGAAGLAPHRVRGQRGGRAGGARSRALGVPGEVAMRDEQRPWYREPWVWFVAALPAAAVAASFAALGFAIATDDGGAAEDYYKQGLAVNQVLRRDARARELHLEATARFLGERVEVVLPGAQERFPQLRLRLIHPTRPGLDQT